MTELEIMKKELFKKLENKSYDIAEAVTKMEKTGQMLNDYLVPSKQLEFDNNGVVKVGFEDHAFTLHRNAVSQIAGRFGVNAKDLQREATGDQWEREVFVDRMNKYKEHTLGKNVLIRAVGGEARAVLSDRYRRLNTAQIFMQFLMAAQESGSVLVDASHSDLRDFMEVVHPEIIEIPTEKNGTIYTVLGAQIRNSDFGIGKHELNVFYMNVVCLNGMVGRKMISDVHLGRKLESTGEISFTEETMNADTKASALAVRDTMNSIYSPENIQRERRKIESAAAIEVDFVQKVKELPKMGLLQGEADLLTKTLMENNPEDGVQGANTLWKLAQGITAVANKVEPDRKRDLQDIASGMLNGIEKFI